MAANGRDHSKAKAVVSNSSIVNKFPELRAILDGNARFQAEHSHDKDLSSLAENVGSMFSDRNVANQYVGEEVKTVVAYSVEELDVVHILIVRHYGCGGVQAAIASSPEESADEPGMARVQEYIQPIREIFANSTRPDIVAMRNSFVGLTTIEELKRTEPGFRALVEENVKANVLRIASDPVVMKHWEHFLAQYSGGKSVQKRTEGATTLKELWITGLVYDIDDGSLKDLEVSVGHPGFTLRGR